MGDIRHPQAAPPAFWAEIAPCEHLLQIYSGEGIFLDSLEGFVAGGIDAGDAVIVIATPVHLTSLAQRLRARGVDVANACATGAYIPLDAEETLAEFIVDGWPDDDLFHQMISRLLAQARSNGKRVRAFGEMVALLWAKGHNGATVRLEYLWHKLVADQEFSLFCAYPKSGFTKDFSASLHDIFAAHSRLVAG